MYLAVLRLGLRSETRSRRRVARYVKVMRAAILSLTNGDAGRGMSA